ncbi:MAG: hypothetical protein ACTSWN_15020 [Promethearchaeota archaeon]
MHEKPRGCHPREIISDGQHFLARLNNASANLTNAPDKHHG